MLAVIARCSDGREGECAAVWCGEQTGVHDAKREETAESELKNRMLLVFLFRLSSVSNLKRKKSSGRSLYMFLK